MKAAASRNARGFQLLRYPAFDHRALTLAPSAPTWLRYAPPVLASPIATSSRVKLPPFCHGRKCWAGKLISPSTRDAFFHGGNPITSRSDSRRAIHSASIDKAQPLERPFDRDLEYQSGPYDADDWDGPLTPLRREDVAKEESRRVARRYQHMVPPEIPISAGTRQGDLLREYEPSEEDFLNATAVAEEEQDLEDWSEARDSAHPVSPKLEDWTDPAATVRRRRRAKKVAVAVQDLPPLEPGESLAAGEERYDLNKTAPSQTPHARGRTWFPAELRVSRERPQVKELEEGDRYYDEVKRYTER